MRAAALGGCKAVMDFLRSVHRSDSAAALKQTFESMDLDQGSGGAHSAGAGSSATPTEREDRQGRREEELEIFQNSCYEGKVDSVAAYLNTGADPYANAQSTRCRYITGPHAAVASAQVPVLELLLKRCDKRKLLTLATPGYTMLHLAAKKGHVDVAKMLLRQIFRLDNGREILDIRDKYGLTPRETAQKSAQEAIEQGQVDLKRRCEGVVREIRKYVS